MPGQKGAVIRMVLCVACFILGFSLLFIALLGFASAWQSGAGVLFSQEMARIGFLFLAPGILLTSVAIWLKRRGAVG